MAIDVWKNIRLRPNDSQITAFATSWFLPTILLAIIRLFFSIYAFTAIAFSFKWYADHHVIQQLQDLDTPKVTFAVGPEGIRQSFSYFTYLTFWGLAFYFFFAALHSFRHTTHQQPFLSTWPPILQTLHTIYYTTITCFPILVTTVYWGSMWSRSWFPDSFSQWSMITMHSLNSVFALFEILVTSTEPFPLTHLPILLLIMSLYLPVAYIERYTEGIYIYLWLDPNNGIAKLLLHIVGYAALITGYCFAVRYILILKHRLIINRRRRNSINSMNSQQPSHFPSWWLLHPPTLRGANPDRVEYWTFDRYERETLREEEQKQQLRMSVESMIQKPEPVWDTASAGCSSPSSFSSSSSSNRSFYSQATTLKPEDADLEWLLQLPAKQHRRAAPASFDPGWPLVTRSRSSISAMPRRSPLRERFELEEV